MNAWKTNLHKIITFNHTHTLTMQAPTSTPLVINRMTKSYDDTTHICVVDTTVIYQSHSLCVLATSSLTSPIIPVFLSN